MKKPAPKRPMPKVAAQKAVKTLAKFGYPPKKK